MTIEDYNPDSTLYTSLNNELLFEPREETDSTKLLINSIKHKIKQNILDQRNFFIFLQTIYLNTYLFSKSMEMSHFIDKNQHTNITAYSYAYDFTVIMFLTYSLNVLSTFGNTNMIGRLNKNIYNKNYILIYNLVTIISAISFSLLGED